MEPTDSGYWGMGDRGRKRSFEGLFDDELSAALEATAAEYDAEFSQRMAYTLDRLSRRGTPVRGMEAFNDDGVVRVRFADGTTILVRGERPGELSAVAMAVVRSQPVLLTSLRETGSGVVAALRWPGPARPVTIRIVGRDQPG